MILNKKAFSFFFATRSKYCIIGGGTGGLNLSAHLLRSEVHPEEIRIFEPSQYHYYQPGWTNVGANLSSSDITVRPMADTLP
jgi:hypothetical protein